mgnify:CR=1 FL=1
MNTLTDNGFDIDDKHNSCYNNGDLIILCFLDFKDYTLRAGFFYIYQAT